MDNDDIMDLFRYYCARDLMLEAANHLDNRNENTLVESKDEDMETESVMHDDPSGFTMWTFLQQVQRYYWERCFMLYLNNSQRME